MKARIKFQKNGVMKYVGHLDIMRYFQKAMRRSGIPIKYSGGFNPHQIMSFAAPLGVGCTSDGEYLDIELKEQISSAEAIRMLSDAMVEGMAVTQFSYLKDGEKNAMASVAAASYELRFKHPEDFSCSLQQLCRAKKEFYDDADAIPVIKKTKKGERQLDLKPLIYAFNITESGDQALCFSLTVSAGSTENVRPEMVLIHFLRTLGVEVLQNAFFIHRVDLFTETEAGFVSLGEVGYEIE